MVTRSPFKEALTGYRRLLRVVLLFGFAINLLMFVSPIYMMQVYDRVLQSRNVGTLVAVTAIALILLAAHGLLDHIRGRLVSRCGLQFDDRIAGPLFERVMRVMVLQPQSNSHTSLSDSARLRDFLCGPGVIALCDLPFTPIFIILCFLFHPVLGSVALVGALLVFALAWLNEVKSKPFALEAQQRAVIDTSLAAQVAQNADQVRALGLDGALRQRWLESHRTMLDQNARFTDKTGAFASISKFARQALQTMILATGAYLALKNQITPGMIIAASTLVGRALGPVDQLVGMWKQVVSAHQSFLRLQRLFSVVPEEAGKPGLPAPKGHICASQVALQAPGGREPILRAVTFDLPAGQCLVVLGPNGAGKSSLLRAMIGAYPLASGSIQLDGTAIGHWDGSELGGHIGYLPQHVELFPGTIAENIAGFRPSDPHMLLAALQATDLERTMRSLPAGLATPVETGDRRLSTGIRQRIGLARALYGRPPLVVLDEPQSFLDSEGRSALVQAIRELKSRGATVVMTVQEPALQVLGDRGLVLAHGVMQACKPMSELMKGRPGAVARQPGALVGAAS